jgi:hypothetical protein
MFAGKDINIYLSSRMLIAPLDITLLFIFTVLAAGVLFYRACGSRMFIAIAFLWCAFQTAVGLSGFYNNSESTPPRIFFGIFPTLLFIVAIFFTKKGRAFVNNLDLARLTGFHMVRIPVEITLSLLFHVNLISVYQTMEGTNFDIVSGLTAPLVGWYAFRHGRVRKKLLVFWNVCCLVLLLNVVITSVLALPGPLQQISFPGRYFAVLHFPFNLLPTFVVPLVLFSHIAALVRLRGLQENDLV